MTEEHVNIAIEGVRALVGVQARRRLSARACPGKEKSKILATVSQSTFSMRTTAKKSGAKPKQAGQRRNRNERTQSGAKSEWKK
mmetsp:Transcript_36365/g.67217  ORF Transcript_36365/g.67217 Transcript_36365/m.67217 type:complete len:84 (+) Transcript_36365:41-292(+)